VKGATTVLFPFVLNLQYSLFLEASVVLAHPHHPSTHHDLRRSPTPLAPSLSSPRSFMESATDTLLVLPGDGSVQRYSGTYSKYLREQQQQQAAAAAAMEQQRAAAR